MDVRFVVLVLCVTATAAWSYRDKSCGDVSGYFTYTISNMIQQPFFRESMKLKICRDDSAPFIRYMEDSVMINPTQFERFSATFTPPYGYLIDSINNVKGNWNDDKTYWEFSNFSGPLVDLQGCLCKTEGFPSYQIGISAVFTSDGKSHLTPLQSLGTAKTVTLEPDISICTCNQ